MPELAVVVPAAGVGKRMLSNCPKQYLTLIDQTVLEHTVMRLLEHKQINRVVIALSADDEYFRDTALSNHPKVSVVVGGQERVDSVLAGLKYLKSQDYLWALVHDAARPCLQLNDLSNLISTCLESGAGGLLASRVKDTMKLADAQQYVTQTLDRSAMWHAMTPQMYKTDELIHAIEQGLANEQVITDESSAIELAGKTSQLVQGSSDNIKITTPEDLALAEFILTRQKQVIKHDN